MTSGSAHIDAYASKSAERKCRKMSRWVRSSTSGLPLLSSPPNTRVELRARLRLSRPRSSAPTRCSTAPGFSRLQLGSKLRAAGQDFHTRDMFQPAQPTIARRPGAEGPFHNAVLLVGRIRVAGSCWLDVEPDRVGHEGPPVVLLMQVD